MLICDKVTKGEFGIVGIGGALARGEPACEQASNNCVVVGSNNRRSGVHFRATNKIGLVIRPSGIQRRCYYADATNVRSQAKNLSLRAAADLTSNGTIRRSL